MKALRFLVSSSFLAAALLLALPGNSPAADEVSEVNGEILDMACYVSHGAKGSSHKRCAQTCAEHGMPLGILTDDGKVYLLYPKHGAEEKFADVKKLAGANAKLTGIAQEKGGILGFEVHSAEAAE